MKTYITPKMEMTTLVTEDVITVSQPTVEWNEAAGEYWVGAASDWWS